MRSVCGVLACLVLGACTGAADEPNVELAAATTTAVSTPTPAPEEFPGSKIFKPAQTPAPGIVMLHGSEGGSAPYIQGFAQQIANAGFVVFTLCWFGCPGKSDKILRIPLESVIAAGEWMKASPDVSNGEVGLFGWSRGAELSLLTTSLVGTAPFQAVAVHAPSDTIVGAFDPATANTPPNYGGILETDPQTGQLIPSPAWTWHGQPLFGEPKPDFSVPGPTIAVVSYTGPVYVSQGENDEVWPVTRGRHVVAERVAVPSLVTESHFYPGEGHVLRQPADVMSMTREVTSFFQRKLAP
jgi:dipeptidyl aminopeptidase/acylaminoacyl peptidase